MKDRSITTATRLCAVIGNPVGHSLSPAIHNAAFDELGLDFIYLAFQVEDLKSALAGMRARSNFRGMSVTIPHKIEAMNHVDEIAEVDRSIGSINTIINDNGRLIGLGTDGPGALKALVDAGVALDGKHVLMLGAGGAARAIAF
ncbi:MAG TPA: shikimate dehydrogenase, partial [Geobacteraceae bacterium]|nr:shikimate dehydrogenase [Geobacteraceae bacterium]